MREALVAQGRTRRNASERSRDGIEAQSEALLRHIERLAYAGDLAGAREALGRSHIDAPPLADRFDRLRAYVACASGDFEAALSCASRLEHSTDRRVRAQAAVTAGSALRQLHRYDDAARVERASLRLGFERSHLLIGLAADAVGIGDARTVSKRIHEAASSLPARERRARIRLAWVRCEHALLTRAPGAAVAFARDALRRSRAGSYRRHEAKSLLFLGASLREAGDPSWRATTSAAETVAHACGAAPIAGAARSMLSENTER